MRGKEEALEVTSDVDRAALECHLRPVGRDVLLNGVIFAEAASTLIEVGKLRVRPNDDATIRRFELAEEHAQQSSLAGTVWTDDPEAISARQNQVQRIDELERAKLHPEAMCFEHGAAESLSLCGEPCDLLGLGTSGIA